MCLICFYVAASQTYKISSLKEKFTVNKNQPNTIWSDKPEQSFRIKQYQCLTGYSQCDLLQRHLLARAPTLINNRLIDLVRT